MNVLAIYAVNQHLADLNEEARMARLARAADPKPSTLRRIVATVRSAFGSRTVDASPTAAGAA